MHNRDRYDRLLKSIQILISVDESLGEIQWLIGDVYDLWRIDQAKNIVDSIMIELDEKLEDFVATENLDFRDGNKTDRKDFIDMAERVEKEIQKRAKRKN